VQVYNNLHIISEHRPVEHNKEGSFLTMWSMEGLVFGIINVIGNFGTVFVDQAYCECSLELCLVCSTGCPVGCMWGSDGMCHCLLL
jgi:hypothetical protein